MAKCRGERRQNRPRRDVMNNTASPSKRSRFCSSDLIRFNEPTFMPINDQNERMAAKYHAEYRGMK